MIFKHFFVLYFFLVRESASQFSYPPPHPTQK
uniref:Uncharacterized protein n=1 Tax=Anguilla anguilla TaxID=7936 RepID=A0A0E9QWL9_ANGAN